MNLNSSLHFILYVIVLVGAVNWGAVALSKEGGKDFNLVAKLFPEEKTQKMVYGVVGASGVALIAMSLFDMYKSKEKK